MYGVPGYRKNQHQGGKIAGPGTGTSDSVKTTVPEGSYIMPADSTAKVGEKKLAGFGVPGYQPAQVPVNVSNGEYQMPPEQVHAVGVQALDAVKNATHEHTGRGIPNKELFFANGGLVEDPQKKRLTGLGIQTMGTQAVQTARQAAVSPATQQPAGRGVPGWQTLQDGLAGGAKALVGAAAVPHAAVADAVRNTATLATGGDPDTLEGGSAKYRDKALGLAKEGWSQAGGATQVLRDAGREALGAQPLATAQPSPASLASPAAPTASAGSPAPSAGGAAPAGRGAPGWQGTGIGGDRQGGEIAMRQGADGVSEFTNEAATPGAVSAGRGVPAPGSRPAASPQPRMGVSGYKTATPQSSIGGGHGLVGNARILAQGSNLLTPDQELARAGSAANVGNGVGTFSQAEAGSAQLALERFERAGQEREKMIAASRSGQIGEGGGRVTVVRDSSRAPTIAELQNSRIALRLLMPPPAPRRRISAWEPNSSTSSAFSSRLRRAPLGFRIVSALINCGRRSMTPSSLSRSERQLLRHITTWRCPRMQDCGPSRKG
jgi:hypothetical protein